MATRDLRFNIFANDRASAAFARASAAADALASRIINLNGRRARIRVEADTSEAERKLTRAQARLDELNRRKASPTIDADIKLYQAKIAKAERDLRELSNEEASPDVALDIAKAEADIARFREKIAALNRQKASPEIDAEIAQAEANVQKIQEEIDYLRRTGAEIEVRADTRAIEGKIEKVKERLTELQRYRSNVDIDADVADANRKIEQLQDELRNLSNRRIRPEVQLQINEAEARLRGLEGQLARLGSQGSSPTVRLQTALVTSQISQVKAQLETLAAQRVDPEVDLEITRVQAEIQAVKERIRELDAMRATPEIEADTARAMAQLALLEARLRQIRDRTVNISLNERFGRGANSLLGYLNATRRAFQENLNGAAQLVRNLRQVALPISIAGLLPALASMGASFREMAGALSLIPAAAGFAGAAIGTLAMGFHGLTDAIGPRGTDAQIEKAELAMSRLGEEARQVARTVIDLKDQWNGLKQVVQNNLFEGVAEVFRSLANQYIPVLENGLGGLATEFNSIIQQVAVFFRDLRTVEDTNRLFTMWKLTLDSLRPSFTNILEAFYDLSVVGSSFLPALGQGFSNLTERFAEFTERARNDGSMQEWMARSIVAINEFGRLLNNIGGVFGAIFDAAQKSGTSFVETLTTLTGELERFLRSGEGQAGLIALFQGIRGAIDAMLPGIQALLAGIAQTIATFEPAFRPLGEAFTALAATIAPTGALLAGLARDIIIPLSAAFVWLNETIGGVVPIVIALAVAFKSLTFVAGMISAIGLGMAAMSTATGLLLGGGVAATKFADGMKKVGENVDKASRALPLIGVALVAGWAIWDQSRSKADEYATEVVRGAKTIEQAIQEEIAQLEARDFWLAQSAEYEADAEANRRAEAERNVTNAIRDQLGAMDAKSRAQAEVNILEGVYLDLQNRLGDRHPETIAALGNLRSARERLASATEDHTEAILTDTEALIENTNIVNEAANADLALERANIRLEEQTLRTAAAIDEHGASSIEGRTATLDLLDAALSAADAARRQAEATAEANESNDAAAEGARAYRDRLIELASGASGPLRDSLIETIANLDSTRRGENDAAIAAAGLTEEIRNVPTQASTTYTAPGLDNVIRNVQDLRDRVAGLNDRTFKIRADGSVVGIPGLATGGILPGYTPGQDIHLAALSGGEAVMRPEWTRAVGADYVYAANAVARSGGIGAVRDWMQNGAPTGGERAHVHEYAIGGVVGVGSTTKSNTTSAQGIWNWPPPTFDDLIKSLDKQAADAIKKLYTANMNRIGGGGGPGGWQWQMAKLRERFPGLALISGYRPGAITATGNRSYHAQGRAVDVPPRMDVFNYIKGTYGANTKELIYSPAGNGQIHNGRPHYYGEPTRGDHWDHVHWAFDGGGEARGKGWMFKNVIKPERMLDPEMTEIFNKLVATLKANRRSSMALPYATPIGSPMPVPQPQRPVQLSLGPILRELADLRQALMSRPQQVINQTIDGARDPGETGRSAILNIRLARR